MLEQLKWSPSDYTRCVLLIHFFVDINFRGLWKTYMFVDIYKSAYKPIANLSLIKHLCSWLTFTHDNHEHWYRTNNNGSTTRRSTLKQATNFKNWNRFVSQRFWYCDYHLCHIWGINLKTRRMKPCLFVSWNSSSWDILLKPKQQIVKSLIQNIYLNMILNDRVSLVFLVFNKCIKEIWPIWI